MISQTSDPLVAAVKKMPPSSEAVTTSGYLITGSAPRTATALPAFSDGRLLYSSTPPATARTAISAQTSSEIQSTAKLYE